MEKGLIGVENSPCRGMKYENERPKSCDWHIVADKKKKITSDLRLIPCLLFLVVITVKDLLISFTNLNVVV